VLANEARATDDHAVAFLARYNTLLGHTLVAPREQVTGDFTIEEYLALQRLVYRVGEAIHWVTRHRGRRTAPSNIGCSTS
jgi:diadenosine tetraphosphate (Ap4A) HIT family hydrolase